jgi:hypothetical protein
VRPPPLIVTPFPRRLTVYARAEFSFLFPAREACDTTRLPAPDRSRTRIVFVGALPTVVPL